MENINILNDLKKTGRDYIKSTIKSKNKVDFDKIKSLFCDGFLELKNFEKEAFDLRGFSWANLERDRNWWWQLQAFPFLNWYVNSYDLQTDEEKLFFYQACVTSIGNWKEKISRCSSPLAWHDHATAFRVRNVVNWLVFCFLNLPDVNPNKESTEISALVLEHLDWLNQEGNFSKHTNHGFDQAMISLTISLMFDIPVLENYKKKSKDRLKDELEYAFSDEGVHKENSPSYQKFMLERLRQLTVFSIFGEMEFSDLVERYLKNAARFLEVITLPNGALPLVGDTKVEEGASLVGLNQNEGSKRVEVYDYSLSGYVVIRGKDGSGKEFYILLKNCHDSNYHRHDDDMMLFLYYDGKTVFGDGGLFNHQENDVRRKNLRSFMAHSVPYISAAAIRNKDLLVEKPTILRVNELGFVMQSSMFGVNISRTVNIYTESSLEIDIEDKLLCEDSRKVKKNFLIDEFDRFDIKNNLVDLYFPDFICKIINEDEGSPIEHQYGWDEERVEFGAYVSKEYGKLVPALRITMQGPSTKIKFIDR